MQKINTTQRVNKEDVCIRYFSSPLSGQVIDPGGSVVITYTADKTGDGSTITSAPGGIIEVGEDGYYEVTANIRCIDVPRPSVHCVQIAADGVTWNQLVYWSPHTRSTPESTGRQLQPISVTVPLSAGCRLRHVINITVGTSRIGGDPDEFGKYHTSLSVKRVKW